MKNKIFGNLAKENEYKESCVFTSIDIFSGAFDYLSFYYICEICFNDFWFVSPYHCYFFVRSKFKKKKLLKKELSDSTKKEENKSGNESDNKEKTNEGITFFQNEDVIKLFQENDSIYYEESETSESKRESYQILIDVINKLTIVELKKSSHLFSENPLWKKNKQTWLEAIIRDKFRRNEKMRVNLGDTGKREIVYKVRNDEIENIRNQRMVKDFYFLGIVANKGQNMLGRIYMNIRSDILKSYEIYMWALSSGNLQTDENLLPDIYIEETYYEKVFHEDIGETELKKPTEESKKESLDNSLYSGTNISVHKKTKNYTFEKKEYISFGKNEKNDVICLNPSISRFHCILYFCKDYHLYLLDVGSKARTKLNSTVCEINKKYKVKNNDIINLGVSKRTYKIQIKVTNVLSYLNEQQKEINNKMEIIHQEINPSKVNKKVITIKNIYYKCNENDLIDFFRDCGPIRKVKLFNVPNTMETEKNTNNNEERNEKNAGGKTEQLEIKEKHTKKKKRTKEALVELYDEETAENIIKKNDSFFYGNKINITYQSLQWNLQNEQWRNREGNVEYREKKENRRACVDRRREHISEYQRKGQGENKREDSWKYERENKRDKIRTDKRSFSRRYNGSESNKPREARMRNDKKKKQIPKKRNLSDSSSTSKSDKERSYRYEKSREGVYKSDHSSKCRSSKSKKRKYDSSTVRDRSRSFSSASDISRC